MPLPPWVRRALKALGQLIKDVPSAVRKAARTIASGVSRTAQKAIDATKKVWRWWNTLPRWIRWACYGVSIMLIVYWIVGFSTVGVVKGSFAASMQSSIGSVPPGHLFATMQSLGAKGTLWKSMAGFGAVVGGWLG
ncbi:hypothetical protein FRB90_011013, partial [Tulasnella sp. 427]